MYSHAVFDFDGVLCDSLNLAIVAFNDISRRQFPMLPTVSGQSDMVSVYGGSLASCLGQWLTQSQQRAFFDDHSSQMARAARSMSPFPGVGRLLSSIGRSSIVSSAYSSAISEVLAKDPEFDSNSLFRIAGREQAKTKTQKIQMVIDDLDITPKDVIYVGDLESDILYCRKVPVDIVCVTYGYHPRWHLQTCAPDYLVDSVDELSDLLGAMLMPAVSSRRNS